MSETFSDFKRPPEHEALLNAIEEFNEKRAEYDKAEADCESSWGWYGQPYEEALNQAWAAVLAAARALPPPQPGSEPR